MGRGNFFESTYTTGKIIEQEMLGKGKYTPEGEYQPYREALDYVKEQQPFDASDPNPRFANDVHATVAEMLALEDYSRLKFYTAVGSMLDKCHGVDAFFELEINPDNPHKVIRVTIDLTANQEKNDYKADLIVKVPRGGIDPTDDKKAFSELVNKTATEIVEEFKKLNPDLKVVSVAA